MPWYVWPGSNPPEAILKCLTLDELGEVSRFCLCGRRKGTEVSQSSDDGGPHTMTHWHKDVERASVGGSRRAPAAVPGTLDAARRGAKIAELRELMEKVERRWQAPERNKSQRERRQRRDASGHRPK